MINCLGKLQSKVQLAFECVSDMAIRFWVCIILNNYTKIGKKQTFEGKKIKKQMVFRWNRTRVISSLFCLFCCWIISRFQQYYSETFLPETATQTYQFWPLKMSRDGSQPLSLNQSFAFYHLKMEECLRENNPIDKLFFWIRNARNAQMCWTNELKFKKTVLHSNVWTLIVLRNSANWAFFYQSQKSAIENGEKTFVPQI